LFRRGFVEGVGGPADYLIDELDDLCDRFPIVTVQISNRTVLDVDRNRASPFYTVAWSGVHLGVFDLGPAPDKLTYGDILSRRWPSVPSTGWGGREPQVS
jgi:hypothetical protein